MGNTTSTTGSWSTPSEPPAKTSGEPEFVGGRWTTSEDDLTANPQAKPAGFDADEATHEAPGSVLTRRVSATLTEAGRSISTAAEKVYAALSPKDLAAMIDPVAEAAISISGFTDIDAPVHGEAGHTSNGGPGSHSGSFAGTHGGTGTNGSRSLPNSVGASQFASVFASLDETDAALNAAASAVAATEAAAAQAAAEVAGAAGGAEGEAPAAPPPPRLAASRAATAARPRARVEANAAPACAVARGRRGVNGDVAQRDLRRLRADLVLHHGQLPACADGHA